MNINSKTKELYESMGYVYAKTEHWNSFCKRRMDLFGFADAIAFMPGSNDVRLIQITTASNASSRRNKILSIPAAIQWIHGARQIHLVKWKKTKRKWESSVEVINEIQPTKAS